MHACVIFNIQLFTLRKLSCQRSAGRHKYSQNEICDFFHIEQAVDLDAKRS